MTNPALFLLLSYCLPAGLQRLGPAGFFGSDRFGGLHIPIRFDIGVSGRQQIAERRTV